ncbi:MAG: 2-oxo acid dehydrogenase subunit E2 [Armatimonadetes bacterium]|nr:2-oxo acid dehydrogenase subunit E2 [Armatimonadota bacterium]
MSSSRPRPDDQPFELVPHTRTRQAIGERTRQSVTEQPQFRVHKLADATALIAARQALKARSPEVMPTFNDFLIKLVADLLPTHRRFNAWWSPEGLKLLQNVNIGFATATDQGVMLPTVLNADRKDLLTIAAETASMVEAARNGKLRATLQMGAGFTISNIGPVGIDAFDAIISPPQTGILAIGSIMPRPVVEGDQVVVRQTLWLSLTCDHRSVDGADGAAFLRDLAVAIAGAGSLVS